MTLTLGQLIARSGEVESLHGVRNYGQESVFRKKFGNIYYNEKVVYYNEKYKILEMRIVFGSAPSFYNSSSNDELHVVRIAFAGVEGRVFNNKQELIEYLNETENLNLTNRTKLNPESSKLSSKVSSEIRGLDKIKGLAVPCTSDPTRGQHFSEYCLPDGRFFYSKTGITLGTKCMVSCTCASYRYTFAENNYKEKAHLGRRPIAYRPHKLHKNSKIKATGPKLNKTGQPGLCKHLMMFVNLLLAGELLKGALDIKAPELRKEIKKFETTRDKQETLLNNDNKHDGEIKNKLNREIASYNRRENQILNNNYNADGYASYDRRLSADEYLAYGYKDLMNKYYNRKKKRPKSEG